MSRAVTLTGYGAILLAAALVEVVARRGHGATLNTVLGALTGSRWARLLLCLAWLWLGWHFFVRVDR